MKIPYEQRAHTGPISAHVCAPYRKNVPARLSPFQSLILPRQALNPYIAARHFFACHLADATAGPCQFTPEPSVLISIT